MTLLQRQVYMATLTKFEDLGIWQEARQLSKEVYEWTNRMPFTHDFSLKDQIRRSSGSLMDNIAEGFDRDGNKEFIQFLSIAKGSAGEVRSQLYRAVDQHYISQDKFDRMSQRSNKISAGILGLINYLRTSEIKGIKFKKE